MAYYFFDRCPENCIGAIENLTRELNLSEQECASGARQWKGLPFLAEKEIDRGLLVRYNSHSKIPLVIQTSPNMNHHIPQVKRTVKKFIDIAKPRKIYSDNEFEFNYDIGEFG